MRRLLKLIKKILMLIIVVIAVKACFAFNKQDATSQVDTENAAGEAQSDPLTADENIPDSGEPGYEQSNYAAPLDGYTHHEAPNGISFDAPTDWQILNTEQVEQIRTVSETVLPDTDGQSKETVFASRSNAVDSENVAMFRVSFVAKDFDENAVQQATQADLAEMCSALKPMWEKAGIITPVGDPACTVVRFKGRATFRIHYRRVGTVPDTTWTVNVFQTPLTDTTSMITTSQLDGSDIGAQQIRVITDSIRID
jgi:hypothetical protein